MKTLKTINFFSILLLSAITLNSCSSDDDNTMSNENEATVTARLYTSNNSDGNITVYDVTDMANVSSKTFVTTSVAADGIYYDSSTDAVIQASRSGLFLEGFNNISTQNTGALLNTDIIGTDDMSNPRETAVSGNFYVVADNGDVDGNTATADGRLFIYERNGSSFTLRNTITTNFKLWGITFIGEDLYAIVDVTSDLAVFTNFLSNTTDATVAASKRITIEGIVRTHGLTYSASNNTMILTDIGDAGNATDGGIHIISNFSTKFNATANAGTLTLSDQIRVSGSNTELGNPVDVAYDATSETVFVAEAANGKILAFNSIGSGGNVTPVINNTLMSASAVYFVRD